MRRKTHTLFLLLFRGFFALFQYDLQCTVYAFGRNDARIAAIAGNAGWLVGEQTKIAVSIIFSFHFMLAAVIKITSKLARSLGDIQIILIIYRTRAHANANINFTIYGQQTHTKTRNHTHTLIFACKHVLPLHILHIGHFYLLFPGFCGFRKRIKKSSEGDFIV